MASSKNQQERERRHRPAADVAATLTEDAVSAHTATGRQPPIDY
ncbi:hypothetical protein [Streptomyces qinzhouensis]|nr:hypothetical protein [Streptomyces qinzhouensis]